MTSHEFAKQILASPDLPLDGDPVVLRFDVNPYVKGKVVTKAALVTDYCAFDLVQLLTIINRVPVYIGTWGSTETPTYILECHEASDTWLDAQFYEDGTGKEVFGFDPNDSTFGEYPKRTLYKINRYIRAHKNLLS